MHQGRIVVVTGAAGAIESKISDRFFANSDVVIGIDRDAEALRELAEPHELSTFCGDITRVEDLARKSLVMGGVTTDSRLSR